MIKLRFTKAFRAWWEGNPSGKRQVDAERTIKEFIQTLQAKGVCKCTVEVRLNHALTTWGRKSRRAQGDSFTIRVYDYEHAASSSDMLSIFKPAA